MDTEIFSTVAILGQKTRKIFIYELRLDKKI
jgi:hypothetical protein